MAAYADTVLARVGVLRALGIAPSRISVMGTGRGTAIATEVMSRLAEPVNHVFVGACEGSVPLKSAAPAPLMLMDVQSAESPPSSRCGACATPRPALTERLLEQRAGRLPQKRYGEWLDDVVNWIKARGR